MLPATEIPLFVKTLFPKSDLLGQDTLQLMKPMETLEAATHSLAPGVGPGRAVCQGHCTVECSKAGKHIPSPESGLEGPLQSPQAASLYAERGDWPRGPCQGEAGPSQAQNLVLLTSLSPHRTQRGSHLSGHYSHLEGLFNQQLTGPTPKSGGRPEHLHFNKFPDDANAAGWGPHSENHCFRKLLCA